jgi:hypothetical protein
VTAVTPPDLEDWLCGYVRALAEAKGLEATVGNKEPPRLSLPVAKPIIVIRDDTGPRISQVTFDRSVGVSVLAGSKLNDKPANDIARWLAGVLMDDAIVEAPGSPIASIEYDGANGPYAVTESLDVARRYLTVEYTVVGTW